MTELVTARLLEENPENALEDFKAQRPEYISLEARHFYIGFWRLIQEAGDGLTLLPYSEVTDWLDENGYLGRDERQCVRRVFESLLHELRRIRAEQIAAQKLQG